MGRQQQQPSGGLCGSDDIAALLALSCTAACFVAIGFRCMYSTSFFLLVMDSLPLAISGIIAIFYVIPCCRRRLPSGLLGGCSAWCVGVWLGEVFVDIWNGGLSSVDSSRVRDVLRTVTHDISSPALLCGGIAVGVSALLLEFIRRKTRVRYQSVCVVIGFLIFAFAAYLTVVLHVAMAVFIILPLDHRFITIGQKTILIAPPVYMYNEDVLLGLFIAGAVVAWLTLLHRPALEDGSWFRSSLLAILVLANIGGIGLCFVDVPSISTYVRFVGDSITWQLLSINTSALLITAFLHSGVQLPHPKKKKRPPFTEDPTSIRVHKYQQHPPAIFYQQNPYSIPVWPQQPPYGYAGDPIFR